MKYILIILLFGLTGCGGLKRAASSLTGAPFEYCYHNVTYLQFPSGATVAFNTDGKPISCN